MDTEWRDVRDASTYTPDRFTPEVYQRVMSGKPRMSSGAQAVLDYFDVPGRRGPGRRLRRSQADDADRSDQGHLH